MSRKTVLVLVLFSVLMASLSVLLAFNFSIRKPLLLPLTVLSFSNAVCIFLKNKYELKLVAVFAVGLFITMTLCSRYTTSFGLPENRITALEGRLLYDSSFSSSGKALVRISVYRCRDNCGTWTTAKGIVTAVGDERAVVTCGLRVRLEGEFSEELFICESLQVVRRSRVNDFREHLIEAIERRLFGEGEPDAPALLSSLLLLGRSEDYNLPLKEAALDCGCSHVLALSGMHLSVLASFCALFGKRRWGKLLSFVVIAAFVFVAGPRPSLVRSAIMFFLGKRFSAKKRLVMAFFIQGVLLPFSMIDIGCCYGYVSVFAIIYLWELVKVSSSVFPGCVNGGASGGPSGGSNGVGGSGGKGLAVIGKLFSPFLLSATVLLFCAPVQLLQEEQWCPIAIIVSPFASFLVTISMIFGLLMLSFGQLKFLLWINSLIYTSLAKLFEVFSEFPKAGWFGYAIMIFIIGGLVASGLLYRKIKKAKIKEYRFIGKIDLNWEEVD